MAVDPEEFYEEEVNRIIESGNKLLGSNFRFFVNDCPALSNLVVSCSPALPGRHLIEAIPGAHGVEVPEPGPLKTGGQFNVTFNDSFEGKAFEEIVNWAKASNIAGNRKDVRIYGTHELGNSKFDMTYTYCFPELNDAELDYANKTTPAKFSFVLHFANRKVTKDKDKGNS